MKLKIYVEESFEYYKEPVMLIASPSCSFKCCREAGIPTSVCQNAEWAKKPTYEMRIDQLVQIYESNLLTKGVVFAGLEPLDSFEDVIAFVKQFRESCNDIVVIYTGYREDEIQDKIEQLKQFSNIVIKVGRYVPNASSRYDDILGVTLASDNQYAIKIS